MDQESSTASAASQPKTRRGASEIDRDLGALMLQLLRGWDGWIHRRVESISLEDPVTFLRRVSVDFTLFRDWSTTTFTTDGEPIFFVPLTLLDKGPITRFDICDENKRTLPVLTKRQNGVLAASVLVALSEAGVGEAFRKKQGGTLPWDIEQDLRDVATLPADAAVPVAQRLRAGGPRKIEGQPCEPDMESLAWREKLKGNDEVWRVADLLAESFILVTPLVGRPGDRRVVKFSYEEQGVPPDLAFPWPFSWLRRGWTKQVAGPYTSYAPPREYTRLPLWLARAVGWRAKAITISTPALAHGGSYHLEVEAPEGLKITRARLESVSPRATLADVQRSLRRVHLYASGRPKESTRGTALISVRPEASTIVRTAWLAAGFATLVLALVASRWRAILENQNLGPTLSLLLIVPAGLAAYVARAREPTVVTEVLFGLRLVAVASAAWLLASAVLMVAGRSCETGSTPLATPVCESWSATGPLLWALVGASLATFWLLTVTLTLILRPPEQRVASSMPDADAKAMLASADTSRGAELAAEAPVVG